MRRRELVFFLAVTAASAVRAEQKTLPVIGYLVTGSPGGISAGLVTAFREGLGNRVPQGP